jgi:SRSO17 transposase
MLPIVEYPSVVSSYLPAFFESVFTRPQVKNFARYITGLMISTNRTISAMNDLFYAHNDQSALNNFITDSTWDDDDLDEARYRIILDGLKRRRSKDCEGDGILAMDDTLSHKTGKHMEYVGYYYDHAEGRQTLAHDILTTHLIKGRLSIPMDFRIYLKEEQLEDKNEFRDKNQMARELIQKAHSKGIPFLYVVGDSWFFSKETAELAGSLGKIWIFESKSDRVVLMPQGWVHLSELAKTVPKEKVKPIKVRYQSSVQIYWCYETNLRMRSMGGERVRVVVSYDNPELEGEPHFYCSNKLDMKADKLLNVYARRWKIDSFYRDAKQSLGMDDYEVRKIEGVRRHLAMVLIAHTLLVLGPAAAAGELLSSSSSSKLRSIDVARTDACLETIGSRCRWAYREVLVSFITLVLKVGRKLKNDAGRIASLALSSRAKLGADFAKV